jgi:hypothetical protein
MIIVADGASRYDIKMTEAITKDVCDSRQNPKTHAEEDVSQ